MCSRRNVLWFNRTEMSAVKRLKNVNPQEAPIYKIGEAAFFVGVPPSTMHTWVYGRDYKVGDTWRDWPALIRAADTKRGLLSFVNIAEAHVLDAMRRNGIPMQQVRDGIELIGKATRHPLVSTEFYHIGRKLLAEYLGNVVSLKRPTLGQAVLMFDEYLERLVRDDRGVPFRLFPVRKNPESRVMLDLYIASGQPVVTGTGILAQFIAERNKYGESPLEIAEDYGIDERSVQDAINFVAA